MTAADLLHRARARRRAALKCLIHVARPMAMVELRARPPRLTLGTVQRFMSDAA